MRDVTTLVEFVKARLDEDEQIAREAAKQTVDWDEPMVILAGDEVTSLAINPSRVLAEVEVKRGLLALHSPGSMGTDEGEPFRRCRGEDWVEWPCRNVRLLASVYADHPDYDSAWRP